MWNCGETLTRIGKKFFFSCHVVKVGEVLLAYEGDRKVKIDQQPRKQQQRLKFFVSK